MTAFSENLRESKKRSHFRSPKYKTNHFYSPVSYLILPSFMRDCAYLRDLDMLFIMTNPLNLSFSLSLPSTPQLFISASNQPFFAVRKVLQRPGPGSDVPRTPSRQAVKKYYSWG